MTNETNLLDRRGFLGATIGSGAALLGSYAAIGRAEEGVSPIAGGAKRVLRLAHMTDVHIMKQRGADRGFAAALKHMHSRPDAPELLVLGGDMVRDTLAHDDASTQEQWEVFHAALQDCRIPVKACLGNHDIWGWNKKRSKTTGDEPLWGKERGVKELHMPHRYYSFEQAGWRFIMLDGTYAALDRPSIYVGRLDDEQFDWFEKTLADTPASQPVIIFSHEPIVSLAVLQTSEVEDYQARLSAAAIMSDYKRILDLFRKHRNVKLCVSGHLHLVERAEFSGVTYICDGAVSAAWWKGDHYDCDEGYGIIDLFADGRFEHQYISYGWMPVA